MVARFAGALLVASLALVLANGADEEKEPISRIAFGSCMNQDRDQGIWKPIVASRPELFLFIGDTIYADTTDIDKMRGMYAKLSKQPGFEKLLATCPLLATWDDHDFGGNDVGAEYPKRKESQAAFLDFLKVPKDSPRRDREGVYHAAVFGPVGKRVQVILLDTRYHRTALKSDPKRPRNKGQYVPNDDPKATILGADQWKWLQAQLKVPAEVRLLASSIQVVAEEHGFEKWGNFPREREKLYGLIRDTKAAGVVLLSGDRHLAELSMMDAEVGYPLYDLTSSGMNMANKRHRALESNRHRVSIMDVGNNFGMVRIDWTKTDPVVSLEIQDEEGDVTIRQKIPLSRLQPKAKRKPPVGNKTLVTEAGKQVGKEWTAELTVRSTGGDKAGARIYLNSEKDFRSEANLAIVLEMKALQKSLEAAKIDDPRAFYLGKKLRVTGVVSSFREKPQIVVKDAKQIEIVK